MRRGPARVDILRGIDLDIPKGQVDAILGPSGSGKTTLLGLPAGSIRRPPAASCWTVESCDTSVIIVEPDLPEAHFPQSAFTGNQAGEQPIATRKS
jgi:ABC-type nitrate/sulfonate/bicarbonate transport system ATPase subunit